MRALKAAIVLAIGCVAASCEADPSTATATNSDAGAETAKPVSCCKLDLPTCDCGAIVGTNADGTCRRGPCDAAPSGWRLQTDERGCPAYAVGPGSCLGPPTPEPDAAVDREVGAACSGTSECDLSSRGITTCSLQQFGDATGACLREGCDPDAPGARCDSGRGICVTRGLGGTCLPSCVFGDDGAAPVGCLGRTVCRYQLRDPSSSTPRGIGFCLGGCSSDADCTTGWQCQREFGFCTKSLLTVAKSVGDACVYGDKCLCRVGSGSAGYCTQHCRVSTEETCPSGFTCDPRLAIEFTKAPPNLAGECAKTCTTDVDCTALNATCVAVGGLPVKVCRPK